MRLLPTRYVGFLLVLVAALAVVVGLEADRAAPASAAPGAVRELTLSTPPEVEALLHAGPVTPNQGNQVITTETFDGAFPPPSWRAVVAQGAQDTVLWSKAECDYDDRTPNNVASAWSVGGGTVGSTLTCGANYTAPVLAFLVYGPFSTVGFEGGIQVEWTSSFSVPQVADPSVDFPYAVCVNVPGNQDPCQVPQSTESNGWVTFRPDAILAAANLEEAQVYFYYRDEAPTGNNFGAFVDNVRITGLAAPQPTATSEAPARNPAVYLPVTYDHATDTDFPVVSAAAAGAYIDFGTGYDAARGMIIDPGTAFQFGIPLLCAKATWVGLDVGTEFHYQWLVGGQPLLPEDPDLNPTINVETRSGALAGCLRATQGGQNVPIPMNDYGLRVYLGGNDFPSEEAECVVQTDPPPGKTAIAPPTAIPTIAPTPTAVETPGTGPDCDEFLINGNFERGPGVAWRYVMQPVVQGRTIVDVIRNDIQAPEGMWAASMGSARLQGGTFIDQLDQPSSPTGLPDPARMISATLKFLGGMATNEVKDGTNNDILLPGFYSLTNPNLDPEAVIDAAFSEESVDPGRWYQFEADVTALMTKRPDWDDSQFFFQSQQNDTAPTAFFVDAAQLLVCRNPAAGAPAAHRPAARAPQPLNKFLNLSVGPVDNASRPAVIPVKKIPLDRMIELPEAQAAVGSAVPAFPAASAAPRADGIQLRSARDW